MTGHEISNNIEQIEGNTVHKIGGAVHINCFALDERYHGILQAYTDEGVKVKKHWKKI